MEREKEQTTDEVFLPAAEKGQKLYANDAPEQTGKGEERLSSLCHYYNFLLFNGREFLFSVSLSFTDC